MSMIEFKDVNKFYGDFHALTDINLKVELGNGCFDWTFRFRKINIDSYD